MSTLAETTPALAREDTRHRVDTTLGMVFFIGSWTMAFGTLFLSFVVLRQKLHTWPPEGIVLPSFPLATLATGVLLVSSWVLHRAVKSGTEGERGFGLQWLGGLLLAATFAGLQAWLWMDLLAAGRAPTSGLYESLFFGLTWVHALHVAVGMLWLAWVQVGIGTGRYGSHLISTVGNAALFWHFVDAVWIVLFLAFFVF
jgi:cytochrome c oxidase subunit 3